MLISHKRKFIFVHIYKNAGTSITSALRPYAAGNLMYKGGRLLKKYNLPVPSRFDPRPFETHITASGMIRKMGRETFDSFFSFAIVRNPWDWQVSLYNYMLRRPAHYQYDLIKSFESFDDYIRWRCREEVRYQKDFIYSEDGELLVDFVGRFERLEEDFQTICSRIGISVSLPVENVSNTIPYQSYYSQESRELVREAFEPDISLFDYTF